MLSTISMFQTKKQLDKITLRESIDREALDLSYYVSQQLEMRQRINSQQGTLKQNDQRDMRKTRGVKIQKKRVLQKQDGEMTFECDSVEVIGDPDMNIDHNIPGSRRLTRAS